MDQAHASSSAPRGVRVRTGEALRHGATHRMLLGSLLAGLGAYGYQVAGARVLGEVAYAPIGVLWTIQYLSLSVVLYSIEAYVTRLTALDVGRAVGLRRAVALLAVAITAFAAALAFTAFVFRDALFRGLDGLWAVVGLTVVSYGAFVVVRGLFAGTDRFGAYGVATAVESLGRLALAVPVLIIFADANALAWVTPLGGLLAAGWWWLGNRVRPPTNKPRWTERAPVPTNPFRFVGVTSVANAASQLILAGGPLALVALGATAAEISVFFITITAARAPLVLAYGGLLSRIMPHLTRLAEGTGHRRLYRFCAVTFAITLAVACLSALAGAVVGPWLIALFFGAPFAPPWWLAAGAIAGVMLATGAITLNQVLIACGAETKMLVPWLGSAAVAAVVVWGLRDESVLAVTVAFVIAELVALIGLALSIRRVPQSVSNPHSRQAGSERELA